MRILVWQWGRRGAGPRFAAMLADALNAVPGTVALLSLSDRAELMRAATPPRCDLPVATYDGAAGFGLRLLQAPLLVASLIRRLRPLKPDVAICAMPGPLDLVMWRALRCLGVPVLVVVHDADIHPGDGIPLQMRLQRALTRRADALVALSAHVAEQLRAQGFAARKPLLRATLPPFVFGPVPPPPRAHGGKLRLLSFGRLLPYKGLDLLADALEQLHGRAEMIVRVVGQGPESPVLDRLRALPGVTVENRWVPEDEIHELLAWSDALVLSHREASQSGVAAAALPARRWIIATNVGGLAEQLRGEALAVMCEPDTQDLADAILRVEAAPAPERSMDDPGAVWGVVAAELVDQIRRTVLAK